MEFASKTRPMAAPAAAAALVIADQSPRGRQLQTLQAQLQRRALKGSTPDVQRAALEEDELLQNRFATVQRVADAPAANRTGLPDGLKAGMEAMSGIALDAVRVHYNSPEPAQLNAHAFARGTDIHLAPGQEQHSPHEAWHVVQQAQGRVRPTIKLAGGVGINDDPALEREADSMGARALPAAAQGQNVPAAMAVHPDETTHHVAGLQLQQAPVMQLDKKKGKSTGQKRKAAREKKASLHLDQVSREALQEEDPTATDTFHAFGDEHRDIETDPDTTGGAHGVFESGNRPEDAPIVERFRVTYNQLDSWAIFLESKYPDLYELANKKFNLDARFDASGEIKEKTKEYKESFRDLKNHNFVVDRDNFEVFVEEKAKDLREIIKKVSAFVTQKNPSIDPKNVHAEGSTIWRDKWTTAVQQVNAIIAELWGTYEAQLNNWIIKQPSIKTKIPVGQLTYIGSLAKSYKGPPKQHVRFNPSDFDVDANLDAPSLAEYAMRHDKLVPDRGRIFGRLTSIKPLIAFADAVQRALVNRVEGIEDNPDDVFDVVIEAKATLEQEAKIKLEAAAYAAREAAQ